ncbi:11567_t:CDS:2 [Entrophospora sp. SA101]|nr:11567_t:CDS:2 [Entrophospora sp. SA101]
MEEGKKVLEITKKFLEQQEFATEKDVRYVNELIKRLNSSVDKAKLPYFVPDPFLVFLYLLFYQIVHL